MTIKGLVFDMDGTLIDSMAYWRNIRRTFCQTYNVPITPELVPLLDYHADWEQFRIILHAHCGRFETPKDFWTECYDLMAAYYADNAVLLPGVMDFLHAMKAKGYRLGIATATTRAAALVAAERTGLLPIMDAFVSTKDIGVEKGFPDVYLECARQMGSFSKEEVVVFEDDLHCVNTLHKHNFTIVGIHDSNMPDYEWERMAPMCTLTIDRYSQLL